MKRIFFAAALLAATSTHADANQASYLKHCSLCHQADAQGIPGTFPRIWGRVAGIAATPDGATFLAQAVMWGMSGTITVDDVPVTGVMPGVPHVSDDEIASILEYLITEGGTLENTSVFSVETVKAVRAAGRIPQAETNARRHALAEKGVIK